MTLPPASAVPRYRVFALLQLAFSFSAALMAFVPTTRYLLNTGNFRNVWLPLLLETLVLANAVAVASIETIGSEKNTLRVPLVIAPLLLLLTAFSLLILIHGKFTFIWVFQHPREILYSFATLFLWCHFLVSVHRWFRYNPTERVN